ncbi:hypothetical protein [Reyranella soli]|nr:hypothetical protein [Reyranella soli]GEP61356.1 hypothetical protein RSO01_85220 [Reyranella soli]
MLPAIALRYDAHTIDLTGIAIKLAVLSESDCSEDVTSIVRDLAAAGIVTPRAVGLEMTASP